MCPGQDTRYWRPDDIFNVPCASCGTLIEFFKDEANRRCPKCSTRVQNPRLTMGCAQWCEHARECLGYDPKAADEGAADQSVADRIIHALKQELGEESSALTQALKAHDRARLQLKTGEASPGIVIPAVLLLEFADEKGTADAADGDGELSGIKRILKASGVGANALDEVCGIIKSYRAGETIDTPEFRAVKNSCLS
jgi:hypothetical protein